MKKEINRFKNIREYLRVIKKELSSQETLFSLKSKKIHKKRKLI